MAESTYRFRRTTDNATVSFTPSQFYAAGRARTRAGQKLYEATSGVPGFNTTGEGLLEPTMVKPEDFHTVASQQFSKTYPTSFAMGGKDVDARWEQSRKDMAESGKRRAAREHYSGAPLVANRALSVMTFGASNAIIKGTMGEEAGDSLLRARTESPGADFLGTILGTVGLAMVPLPGAGALGGRIAGGKGASAAANVRNLFGISAAAGQAARNRVLTNYFVRTGSKALPVSTRINAGIQTALASGIVAEVPLSAAIASADLIDNNKPWTMEAAAIDTGIMVAWGMGIATLTGLPVIAGRHILGGAARGARRGLDAATRIGEAVVGGIGYRGTRFIRAKGTYTAMAAGSALESIIRTGAKQTGRSIRRRARDTGAGMVRFVMDDVPDNFVIFEKTLREGVSGYDVTRHVSAQELRKNAKRFVHHIDDPLVAQGVRDVIDNADDVMSVRNLMADAPRRVDDLESWLNIVDTQVPKGVRLYEKGHRTVSELQSGLHEVALNMDVWNRDFASAWHGLGKQGQKVGVKKIGRRKAAGAALAQELRDTVLNTGDARGALKKVLELRKRIATETGNSAQRLNAILDARIDRATGGASKLVDQLQALDRVRWNLGKNREIAEGLAQVSKVKSKGQVEKFASNWQKMEIDLDGLHASYGTAEARKKAYREAAKEWSNEANRTAAQQVAGMNELRSNLLTKDSWYGPGIEHPIFSGPSRNFTREELLETQLHVAARHKVGVQAAFRYLSKHGGPGRQSAAFYGVFHYRQMSGHDERLDAFEANRDALLATANGPESAIQHLGYATRNVASVDQELATGMSMVNSRAAQYLLQHMPRNEDNAPPSASEVDSWLERLGALQDPVSLLFAAKDGSVMPEAVDAVRTVYPALYVDMILDTVNFVNDSGEDLDYASMLGLDAFTGGALGVADSVTPMQPPMAQTPLQSQAMGSFGPQRMQQLQATMQTPNQKLGGL